MKRRDPQTGMTRDVTYYATITHDLDPDNNWKEKETWRFDIYEKDPESYAVDYLPNGEFRHKGKAQVVHCRGGLPSREVAAELAAREGLNFGWEVEVRGTDQRDKDGPEVTAESDRNRWEG